MSSAFRRNFLILWSDLLIALSAFWLARYFGDMPRWYWLVLSAVVWVVLGGVSRKLQFGAYKRIRYAFLGIFALDVLSGLFLCTLYHHIGETEKASLSRPAGNWLPCQRWAGSANRGW